ncbi:hypothetical protein ABE096_12450 [Robertmurraya massiliosenegalensis]
MAVLYFVVTPSTFAIVMYERTGSIFQEDPHYQASEDRYIIHFDDTNVYRVWLAGYSDSSYSTIIAESDIDGGNFTGLSYFSCKTYYRSVYYDRSGNVLGTLKFYSDEVQNESCMSGVEPNDPSPEEGCDSCAVFECPNWSIYMGKLDEIKNAIPPAPNWQQVANTFRDTIVPSLIGDLGNLLGSAPNPPSPPSSLGGIDDRGFKDSAPQGNEAPGLGDTDYSKIKDEAPKIPETPDTSDGFTIMDPVDNLPSQDEFKDNVPKDEDNFAPPPPKDNEEDAPVPEDETGDAPIPEDDGASAPMPEDNIGTAPVPEDQGGQAPTPGDGGSYSPPIPGGSGSDDESGPPVPGDNGGSWSPPMPGNNEWNPPIPGGDDGSPPIPGNPM